MIFKFELNPSLDYYFHCKLCDFLQFLFRSKCLHA